LDECIGLTYRGTTETKLYQLIWKPLEPFLADVETIYYAPTGLLHRVSMTAINEITGNPLLNRYHLVHLGSTRELVLNQDSLSNVEIHAAMLYGGINYAADSTCLADSPSRQDQVNTTAFLNESPTLRYRGGCDNREIANLTGTKIETDQ
jgi:hypothetical protein